MGNGLRSRPVGDGPKLRVLTGVDTFSRYVPVLDPRFSYRGEDVVRSLERVCSRIARSPSLECRADPHRIERLARQTLLPS